MVTFQMSMSDAPPPAAPGTATCARCDKPLTDVDRVLAVDRAFCRSCYETLTFELQQAMTRMSQDINYPLAALGAALGGAAGALAWWGFTVLTQFGFGLIAVVIGFLAGHGAVRFAGGKRSAGLQAIAVVAGTLAFLVATYLVNMSFVNQVLHERGEGWRVPFPPDSLETVDLETKWPLLKELADRSGGKVYTAEDAKELVERLANESVPHTDHFEWRLWQSWWVLLAVVLLLTVEWVARKWAGLP